MFNNIKKIVVMLLAAAMGWAGLCAVSGTYALFSTQTTSIGNTLAVGTLAFTAAEARDESACSPANEICGGGDIHTRLNLAQAGSLDFNYSVSIANATLSPATTTMDICDNLTVNDGTNTQALKGYRSNVVSFSSAPALNLTFNLASNDPLLQDQTCDFDYVITAWQANLSAARSGFTNKYIIHSSITSDHWVADSDVPITALPTFPILNGPAAALAGGQDQAPASSIIAADTGIAAVTATSAVFQAVPQASEPSADSVGPLPVLDNGDKAATGPADSGGANNVSGNE